MTCHMIAAINHLTGRHPASYQRGSLYASHRKLFVNQKKNIWQHLIDIALMCFIPSV